MIRKGKYTVRKRHILNFAIVMINSILFFRLQKFSKLIILFSSDNLFNNFLIIKSIPSFDLKEFPKENIIKYHT